MRMILTAALGSLMLMPVSGRTDVTNLVTNGDFTSVTGNLATLDTSRYSGAEIDSGMSKYNAGSMHSYATDVTGWMNPKIGGQTGFNLYNFGQYDFTKPNASINKLEADTRFSEKGQYPNTNFTGPLTRIDPVTHATVNLPFMILDGDQSFNSPLEQEITKLVAGKTYQLTFDWAGSELADRQNYYDIKLTGSIGNTTFDTGYYDNTNYAPNGKAQGSFSGWTQESVRFVATASDELLSFLAVGNPQGLPPVALLADVSIEAVPEPSAAAILLGGCAGLIFAAVRMDRARARTH